MKLTGLMISAVVLLALVGGLYWSNNHKPAESTATFSWRQVPANVWRDSL